MLDIYGTLEVKKILEDISSLARSENAKEDILALKILPSKEEVKAELDYVDEMMRLLFVSASFPLTTSFKLDEAFELAAKGGTLTINELSKVDNDIIVSIKLLEFFFKLSKNKYPCLFKLIDGLTDVSKLHEHITRVISDNLTIYDDASEELYRIRKQIKAKEDNIRKFVLSLVQRYKDYLAEATYTIRNGHFVLPFKTANKNKIEGIIHDISDSGLTTFIEPSPLVEESNEIFVLRNKEKEEIQRILKILSAEVGVNKDKLVVNNAIISKIDFIYAKAIYGVNNKCEVANLVFDKRVISLTDAAHPLIDKETVVKNSFYLDKDHRLIVISGPNAGGKTVALKTLGLMVLMTELGLAIPTSKKAELSYFPKIYADIGDNQSLSDNLSTFSAHISNIARITKYIKGDDLVLIDELGTGTSPLEGEAIAISVIDYLFKKECFGVISSHFDKVKEYAYSKDGVDNAMMIFDDQKLLPTYRLRIGLPGKSYGLEMAKRYHLDDEIISDSKKRLARGKKDDVSEVIQKLNNVLKENEDLSVELKEKERIIAHKEKELADKEEKLNLKKETLLEDVKLEKERLIEEAKQEIKQALRVLSNPNVTQQELLEARKKVEELDKEEEEIYIEEELHINDYVNIPDLNQVGVIKDIKSDKLTIISNDGMTIKTTKQKVRKTTQEVRHSKPRVYKGDGLLKPNFSLELNIIGDHIDEALPKIQKYLDEASLHHAETVRIIHGKGSGALRKLTRDYLKTCPFVKSFGPGGYYDGGDGATVVILK